MSEGRPDHARRTGPALEAMYRFLMWLVPTVEKFPRSQKFLLGDRIQSTALDVLECLIEATYTRDDKVGPHRDLLAEFPCLGSPPSGVRVSGAMEMRLKG